MAFSGQQVAPGNLVQVTAAVDIDDFLLYDATTGMLFCDADGTGGAASLQFAVIENRTALASADFFVV